MKVSEIKVIMVVALSVGISFGIPWPVAQQDSVHATIKTYGDWNATLVIPDTAMGYHGGVDIPADSGTPVYAVIDGVVSEVTLGIGSDTGLINIALDTLNSLAWSYHHIHYDTALHKGDSVHIGDCLGHVARFQGFGGDHLHFMRSDNKYRTTTGFQNPLDVLIPAPAQMPYIMDRPGGIPHHPKVIFYVKDGSEDTTGYCYETSYLRDSIDIIVFACTEIEGRSENGVYSIGYGVHPINDGSSISFREMFEMRDTISEADSLRYYLTYAEDDSLSSHFRNFYVVTNCGDSLSPDSSGLSNIKENCWPTKMNIAGTADADSIEDARFPDGYYVTTIKVWSHSGDSAAALDTVLVDNFNPRVKIAYPTDHYHHIEKYEKEVWCTFSEAMDTATLIPANITIRSLVDTSHYYSITNITYVDSLFELILEVDSFDFHDEVEVQLSDSITDLAGKSHEQGHGKETCIAWTEVGTAKMCARMAHMGAHRCNTDNVS